MPLISFPAPETSGDFPNSGTRRLLRLVLPGMLMGFALVLAGCSDDDAPYCPNNLEGGDLATVSLDGEAAVVFSESGSDPCVFGFYDRSLERTTINARKHDSESGKAFDLLILIGGSTPGTYGPLTEDGFEKTGVQYIAHHDAYTTFPVISGGSIEVSQFGAVGGRIIGDFNFSRSCHNLIIVDCTHDLSGSFDVIRDADVP